jgi:translation initiation factor IF-3
VIDDNGEQLGIMPPPQALTLARSKGLDLVGDSRPRRCRRSADHGLRQVPVRAAETRAVGQEAPEGHSGQEIKFRRRSTSTTISSRRSTSSASSATATSEGDDFFRGRENAHPEIGHRILERLIGDLEGIAVTETAPQKEGNQLHTILARGLE